MARECICLRTAGALLCLTAISMSAGAQTWTQTNWSGGPGQLSWSDSTMYYTGIHEDGWRVLGDLKLDAPDDSNWTNTGDLAGAMEVRALVEASDGALYAGIEPYGNVFKSIDAGATWVNTGDLAGAMIVWALVEASDGALYAGTEPTANVFKSIDAGTTWVNTGDLAGAWSVYSLLEASDGALYAGTSPTANVFKSIDAGTTWVNTGDLAGASEVYTLIEASDGALYAGTYPSGDVFKSVDAGTSWINTGDLDGVWTVYSLLEASDGALYAGTWSNGSVFKSVDAGTTWANTGDLAGATCVSQLLEASDGALYVGIWPNANVCKSVDAGTTWVNTGGLAGAMFVLSLLQASDGALYAGTGGDTGGDVFKAGYFLAGDIVSSVYDIGSANVTYGTMTWNETPNGQIISMLVRTDTLPDMSTAMDWDTCPPVVNGQDISGLASVDDYEQYIQYRAQLVTTRSDVTPVLHDVSIEYELVGVDEGLGSDLPLATHQLLQNRPNPFSGRTVISYSLPSAAHVTLDVYDLSGRLVETLINETKGPGIHSASWNANGRAAGLYFYRLRAGDFKSTRKMVVID
jgi:photosystem II stability/assembly factor-like uncharacterized protein